MSKAKSTGWRDLIQVHPAAKLFPLMSPEELQALGEDIRTNGLKMPIALLVGKNDKPKVLDGRK